MTAYRTEYAEYMVEGMLSCFLFLNHHLLKIKVGGGGGYEGINYT